MRDFPSPPAASPRTSALALSALLIVAACDSVPAGNQAPEPANAPASTAPAGGVALALLRPSAEGMTAAASGTLGLRGRCLVLEGGGETTQLAFATADTRWDASARALRVGSRSFALGSRVEIGGGEFAGNADTLAWVRRPSAECGGRFWIVSSINPA